MFENIPGQVNAIAVLRSMIESVRIPHTLLFVGPYGVGKGETAFELSRILLCENGVDSGCNTCGSCVRASQLEHPDLHVLFPFRDKPASAEKYASWLEELQAHRKLLAEEPYAPVHYEKGRQIVKILVSEVLERLFESSFEGGRRVCVILAADKLNPTTANSLLKILEEPPDGVHFILTTERLSSVLPTIISRSSIVRFRRLRNMEIELFLEKIGVSETSQRHSFALAGEGSVKTAKALAFGDRLDKQTRASEIFTSVATGGYDEVISAGFPFLWSRDSLEAEELIYGFSRCTRSVLEIMFGIKSETHEYTDTFKKLSRSTDIQSLRRLLTGLEKGLDMLGRNVNISMVLTTINYEIHDAFGKGRHKL